MISEQFAKDQILRMAGLQFFCPEKEAFAELWRALQECTVSEDHAREVLDGWLRYSERTATPADIRRMAAISHDRFANRGAPCLTCSGDRFIPCYVLRTQVGPGRFEQQHISKEEFKRLSRELDSGALVRVYEAVMPCPKCTGKTEAA